MANNKTVTATLKVVSDFNDVLHNANQLKNVISSINVPQGLKGQFDKIFGDIEKHAEKASTALGNGFKTKGDVSNFEKTINSLNADFDKLVKTVGHLDADSFGFDDLEKEMEQSRARVNELRKSMEQLLQVQAQLVNGQKNISKASAWDDFKDAFNSQDIDKAEKALGRLEAQVQKAKEAGKNMDTGTWAEYQKGVNVYRVALDNLKGQTESTKKTQQQLNEEFEKQRKLSDEGVRRQEKALNDYTKATIEARDGTKNLGKQSIETASSMEQINGTMDRFKTKIAYFFGAENAIRLFKRAVQSAYETVKDLDAVMTETAVVTNFSVGDMWSQLPEYTKRANELGVSIHSVYEASTLYYQQGLKTNEVMQVTNATLRMARIASLDAAEATDRVTNALRGFNMEINESNADRIADVYSKLAAMSASNVDEISTAMTKVASLANSANMEFENTAAFLAQIIETTRESAETAGTALKTVVARFSEVKKLFTKGQLTGSDEEGEIIDVNKVSTALRTAGIDLNEFLTGAKGLDEIFMELASKWDSLDIVQQRYIATMAAGSRQQSRFIALMSDYQRTQELTAAAQNANGASMQQYEKTLESLQSKLARLRNAWDEFVTSIANSEFIKGAVDALTNLLGALNKISAGSTGFVKSITNIGVAIGGLAIGKGIFNKLLKNVGTQLGIAGTSGGKNFVNNFISKVQQDFSKADFSKLIDTKIKIPEIDIEDLQKKAQEAYNKGDYKNFLHFGAEAKDAVRINNAERESILALTQARKADFEALLTSNKVTEAQLGLLSVSQQKKLAEAVATGAETTQTNLLNDAKGRENALQQGGIKGLLTAIGMSVRNTTAKGAEAGAHNVNAGAIIKETAAQWGLNSAMLVGIATVAAVVLVIGALVAALIYVAKTTHQLTLEEKFEQAKERADALNESFNETKEKVEGLKDSLEKLKDQYKTIKSLESGTEEWKTAVYNTNEDVRTLIENFKEAGKYVNYDPSTGMLSFNFDQAENDDFFGRQKRKELRQERNKLEAEQDLEAVTYEKTVGKSSILPKTSQQGTRYLGNGEYMTTGSSYGLTSQFDPQEILSKVVEGREKYWDQETFDKFIKDNFNLNKIEGTKGSYGGIINGKYEQVDFDATYDEMKDELQSLFNSYQEFLSSQNYYLSEVKKNLADYAISVEKVEEEKSQKLIKNLSNSDYITEEGRKATEKIEIDTKSSDFRDVVSQIYGVAREEVKDDGSIDTKDVKVKAEETKQAYIDQKALEESEKILQGYYNQINEITDESMKEIASKIIGGVQLTEEEYTKIEKKGGIDKAFSEAFYPGELSKFFDPLLSEFDKSKKHIKTFLSDYGLEISDSLSKEVLDKLATGIESFINEEEELNKDFIKVFNEIPLEDQEKFIEDFSKLNFMDDDSLKEFAKTWGIGVTQQLLDAANVAKDFDVTSIIEAYNKAIDAIKKFENNESLTEEEKDTAIKYGISESDFTQDDKGGYTYIGEGSLKELGTVLRQAIADAYNEQLRLRHSDQTVGPDRASQAIQAASDQGIKREEVTDYAATIQNIEKTKKLSRDTALSIASNNLIAAKSFKDLRDNWEVLKKGLESDKSSVKYAESLRTVRDDAKHLLSTDKDLSEQFLTDKENLKLLERALNDDEKAFEEFRKKAAEDIILQYGFDDTTEQQVIDSINGLQKYAEDNKLEIGAVIDDNEYLNALDQMLTAGQITTDQMNEILSGIGWTPQITYAEMPLSSATGFVQNQDQEILIPRPQPDGTIEYEKTTVRAANNGNVGSDTMVRVPVIGNSQMQKAKTVSRFKGFHTTAAFKGTGGALPKKDTSKKGGGGGSSKKDKQKNWKNPYDELYNLEQEINETTRQRNLLEAEYDLMLNDRTKANDVLLKNSYEQLKNLEKELALQKEMQAGRKRQLDNILNETYEDSEGNRKTYKQLGVEGYARYDQNTQTIVIDWEGLEKLAATAGSEEKGKAVEDYIKRLEELSGQFEEIDSKVLEIEKQVQEIRMHGMDDFTALQQRTLEAFVKMRQDQIDEFQALSDTISDSTNKVIDGIRSQVEAERQARQNEQAEQDMADKEARLAYLQRDTSGANDLEIMKLNDELAKDRQNYTDSLIDQGIEKMQEQADKAQEQRQRQIDLMTAQLALDQQNGAFNEAVKIAVEGALTTNTGYLATINTAMGTVSGALVKNSDGSGKFITDAGDVLEAYEGPNGGWSIKLPEGGVTEATVSSIQTDVNAVETDIATVKTDTGLLKGRIYKGTNGNGKFITDTGDVLTAKMGKDGKWKVTLPSGAAADATVTKTTNAVNALTNLFKKAENLKALTPEGAFKWESDLLKDIKTATEGWANFKMEMAKANGSVKASGKNLSYKNGKWVDADGNEYDVSWDSSGKFVAKLVKAASGTGTSTGAGKGTEIGAGAGTGNGTGTGISGSSNTGDQQRRIIHHKGDLKTPAEYKTQTVSLSEQLDDWAAKNASFRAGVGEYKKLINTSDQLSQQKAASLMDGFRKAGFKYDASKTKKVQTKAATYYTADVYGYATGGLADFTGPAWLDGTKSKPEIVLNPEDSQNLITLKDILSQLLRNPIQSGTQGAGGDNYYEINIDAEIANDYDVDRLASRIKQQIYSDSMYRNVNTLNWQR